MVLSKFDNSLSKAMQTFYCARFCINFTNISCVRINYEICVFFWLGIPDVVLHELFVKLVQNLPKKMGDINFFEMEKAKTFENL